MGMPGYGGSSSLYTLSAVCFGKFSFSYNTLFLSSLGFVATQYAPSGVSLHENAKFKELCHEIQTV